MAQPEHLTSEEAALIHARLEEGDRRMTQLAEKLAENTAATARVEQNTQDLVIIMISAQGAFKVLTWIGRIAKPVWYIAAAAGAIWGMVVAIKSGVHPK